MGEHLKENLDLFSFQFTKKQLAQLSSATTPPSVETVAADCKITDSTEVVVAEETPTGSCGGDKPSKVEDCLNVDMGSCGNACCKLVMNVLEDPATVANRLNSSLANGGPDGYYTLQPLA